MSNAADVNRRIESNGKTSPGPGKSDDVNPARQPSAGQGGMKPS